METAQIETKHILVKVHERKLGLYWDTTSLESKHKQCEQRRSMLEKQRK